jgi:hypothetical protein
MLEKITPALAAGKMKYLDWTLAIITLCYASYSIYDIGINYYNIALLLGGMIGVALAIVNPAKIISLKIQNKMNTKIEK